MLGFGPTQLAFVNVFLCGLWILLCIGIAREHRRITDEKDGVKIKV